MNITILTAIYNDWPAFERLLIEIEDVFISKDLSARIVVVNDGSDEMGSGISDLLNDLTKINCVEVVDLAINLGNQRAIAVGLSYVASKTTGDWVVILDGDGEDRPADIPWLLEAFEDARIDIVVASRNKREDSRVFRFFYSAYKSLYRTMTGRRINFGNFSAMSYQAARYLCLMPDLWVHFPTAVLRSRLRLRSVPVDRGGRYTGESKMSFVPLAIHALSGIALFSETAVVRILVALAMGVLTIIAAIFGVAMIRLFTDFAIPGWSSTMVGWMLVILVQLMLGGLLLAFMLVGLKTLPPFWPAIHYRTYIAGIREFKRREFQAIELS